MEPETAGGNSSKNDEEGADSISDDESRSSFASSASVASATSAELSSDSDDPEDIDRNDYGRCADDNQQSEDGLPEQVPSASPMLESPPVQVMERPPGSSVYRIPSRVFASSKSGTPNPEWSIASNESLFSIQNMSFAREEFNMLLKSGELGMYGDLLKSGELATICKSGELPPPLKDALKSLKEQLPGMHPDTRKSGEQKTSAADTDVGIKNDDPTSETRNRKGEEPSADELPCPATVSRETEALAPSFASQVVSKSERSSSASSSGVNEPKESDSSDSDKYEELKGESEIPAEASSFCSWFSCFSSCSCCAGSGKTS